MIADFVAELTNDPEIVEWAYMLIDKKQVDNKVQIKNIFFIFKK